MLPLILELDDHFAILLHLIVVNPCHQVNAMKKWSGLTRADAANLNSVGNSDAVLVRVHKTYSSNVAI